MSGRPAGAFAASPSRAQTAVNGATRADFPANRLAQIGGMNDSRLSGGPPRGRHRTENPCRWGNKRHVSNPDQ